MSKSAIDEYAAERREEIEAWLAATPDWGTRVMSGPGRVAAAAAQQIVPVEFLRGAFAGLNRAAARLSGQRDILKWADAESLEQLAALPLEDADRLARRVERRSMVLAGSSGAALGIGGAAGMVFDVPALLTLALRTIHRTAFCYGEDWQQRREQGLATGVFALASANSLEEKQQAWAALQQGEALLDEAWRDGVERVAERELAKNSTQFSLQTLSSRIGIHLGSRKAAGVAPLIGAVVGATVNAGYIHDIARVSRFVLQDRWLAREHNAAIHLPKAVAAPRKTPRRRSAAK